MKIGSFAHTFEYKINGVALHYVNDLGVEFDNNLNVSTHCSIVAKIASRQANMILRAFQSRNFNSLLSVFLKFLFALYWNTLPQYGFSI